MKKILKQIMLLMCAFAVCFTTVHGTTVVNVYASSSDEPDEDGNWGNSKKGGYYASYKFKAALYSRARKVKKNSKMTVGISPETGREDASMLISLYRYDSDNKKWVYVAQKQHSLHYSGTVTFGKKYFTKTAKYKLFFAKYEYNGIII